MIAVENLKQDKEIFEEESKEMQLQLKIQSRLLQETQNHCQTIENYLDKYQCIRI